MPISNPERRSRAGGVAVDRSEEHTSELQSRLHFVCRLLLEKKKDEIHGIVEFLHPIVAVVRSEDHTLLAPLPVSLAVACDPGAVVEICSGRSVFFFNDAATPEIYTLPLPDALPIWRLSASILCLDLIPTPGVDLVGDLHRI